MILERADCTFGGIDAMFLGGNTLKLDVVFDESFFQIVGAFVVEHVQLRWVTLVNQVLMSRFPGRAEGSSESIGNGGGVNGVRINVI